MPAPTLKRQRKLQSTKTPSEKKAKRRWSKRRRWRARTMTLARTSPRITSQTSTSPPTNSAEKSSGLCASRVMYANTQLICFSFLSPKPHCPSSLFVCLPVYLFIPDTSQKKFSDLDGETITVPAQGAPTSAKIGSMHMKVTAAAASEFKQYIPLLPSTSANQTHLAIGTTFLICSITFCRWFRILVVVYFSIALLPLSCIRYLHTERQQHSPKITQNTLRTEIAEYLHCTDIHSFSQARHLQSKFRLMQTWRSMSAKVPRSSARNLFPRIRFTPSTSSRQSSFPRHSSSRTTSPPGLMNGSSSTRRRAQKRKPRRKRSTNPPRSIKDKILYINC